MYQYVICNVNRVGLSKGRIYKIIKRRDEVLIIKNNLGKMLGIVVNDIDFKMDFDLSDIDLSYISNEFLGIASAVAAAHSELQKFTSMYNTLGSNLDLMEEMKADLETNGTFSEEMIDKILGSGNADLIALLDDEGNAYQNLINLIGEYTQKQEEANVR